MPDGLAERFARLELRVTALEQLRAEIPELSLRIAVAESQILHLRTQVWMEVSAVRRETGEGLERLDRLLEEKWQQARVLHEDVVDRIKTLDEHRVSRRQTFTLLAGRR